MKRLLVGIVLVAGAVAAEPRTSLGPSVLTVKPDRRHAEQGILTPVPISIDLPAGMRASRVLVHYKMWGSPEWTTLALTQTSKQRWLGAIPCLEVSTITGDLVYYIRVHDADGGVIAYSGSRFQPYRVTVIHDSLRPGAEKVLGRCPDPAACPPGLPGCPSERVEKVPCKQDLDCEGGMTCSWDGFCELDERSYNWVTLEAGQDFGVVATRGACSVYSQENEGWACYRRSDGDNYLGDPELTNEPLRAGVGQTRLYLGFERLVYYNTSVGIRVGYAVFGEGPTLPAGTSFVPYSGELRVSHWFGSDPFSGEPLRPFAFVSAGAGMFDIKVPVHVRERIFFGPAQGGNDWEQTLDGWRRAGDAFAGLGGGVSYSWHPSWALSAEAAALQTFPYRATLLVPRIGIRHGF